MMQRSSGIRRSFSAIATLPLGKNGGSVSARAASVTWTSCRTFTSSVTPKASFVAVDHSKAYEVAMQGPHGKQLALARLEGTGKDDPPFDPFAEMERLGMDWKEDDEMGNDRLLNQEDEDNDCDDDDDDEEDEDDEDNDENEFEIMFNPDGSVRRKKSVLATLRAGFPSGGQFAVFELGGTQFKVTTDDVIVVNRLKPVEKYSIGSTHTLTDVMLVGSSHLTLVGVPFVQGAEVDVMVEEITRDAKVIIFKKRRRKHSQRKNGFRRDVTMLRVVDIRMPTEYRNHSHIGREIVDTLDEHFDLEKQSSPPSPSTSSFDTKKNTKLQSNAAI